MKRPSNDAWYETQKCGPLFVVFRVDDDEGTLTVVWWVCADDEDKNTERAFASNEYNGGARGSDITKLIDQAMEECSTRLITIARDLLEFVTKA